MKIPTRTFHFRDGCSLSVLGLYSDNRVLKACRSFEYSSSSVLEGNFHIWPEEPPTSLVHLRSKQVKFGISASPFNVNLLIDLCFYIPWVFSLLRRPLWTTMLGNSHLWLWWNEVSETIELARSQTCPEICWACPSPTKMSRKTSRKPTTHPSVCNRTVFLFSLEHWRKTAISCLLVFWGSLHRATIA